ncbi:sensor histidine kinase [Halorarum halobium]|uniref:sensor histidine kinase n=1 Tax=Halorarum halobium TaxID=3075121 RepID=UPI0028A8E658|nr:HAMP domain-containing sensor histidine kinase [Halobaculum sp. XH14]
MTVDGRGEGTERGTAEKLANLHAATREMMLAESSEEVAGIAATAATDVLGFSLNTVRLHEESPERLLPTAVSPAVEELAGDRRAYERGETVQWDAFDGDELLTFQDITEIDDDVPRTGEGSMLVAPLAEHGVLTLGSVRTADIDPADVELARVLAANVEAAMNRAERRATLAARTARLERQNERLDGFASIVSHDLRNPLNVAAGNVDLARETGDLDRLDAASDALDRMDGLIDSVLTLAREGRVVEETEPIGLSEISASAWSSVDAPDASFTVAGDAVVEADRERLRTLLENCFRNAVDHCGPAVSIRVEPLDGGGFAVCDDGPGIRPDEREEIFERGYTTTEEGTGFGLAIVRDVADAHGWSVTVTESDAGGSRFEFTLTR